MTPKAVNIAHWWQLAPSGLIIVDGQGCILQVNQTLCHWLGYAENQLVHQPVSTLFTTEARLLYQGVLSFRLSDVGAVDEIHLNLRTESGEPFPVLSSARRLTAPDPPLTLLAMLPIARMDKLERERLESRQSDRGTLEENRQTIAALESMRIKLESHNQELHRLTLRLAQEARSDPLTGLPNRRHFDLVLQERLASAFVNQAPKVFSVAILDIDLFKPINDNYGHAVGDQVLQQLARLLTSLIQGSDLVARIGGEEFAFLMSETSLEEAGKALEGLRHAIEVHPWLPKPITASIGVTSYLLEDTSESLMARADRALYMAKHLGRNNVAKG
ncbi:MAG: diguanylate cyclase [Vreelandella alkaliphila]|uniref:diguanylate cyclase n=1 Tax=Halomonas campaniensis TaxID=213554 RepID=A0A3D0KD58_9GAMM|nr:MULTISPECIES: sensor domain-containing diguanylate cyclase [unclassified Halomonas]HBP41352.1 hypothetical protein [Halomonas sp.]HBS83823.1 hypothetical protein [Halomonas campaniensis]HCA01502.1 hypothetical protein [Halomonas campaniensis]